MGVEMLASSVRERVGEMLEITPSYGWGWHDIAKGSFLPYEPIYAAGSFRARLLCVWEWQGDLRGGIARVEQPNHPFEALWLVFYTMSVGVWELDGQLPPRIDVDLGSDEPVFEAGWPVFYTGARRIHGHVRIEMKNAEPEGSA
jgi:hypothetical protein